MRQDDNLLSEIDSLASDERAKVIDFIQRLKAKRKISDGQDLLPISTEKHVLAASKNEPEQNRLTFGCMKGTITYMAEDFNDPLEDFADYM